MLVQTPLFKALTDKGLWPIIPAMISDTLRRKLETALSPDNISFALEDLHLYAYDGTGQTFLPEAVVWPSTTAQIGELVRMAGEAGVAVVPRGAGSGLSGGALPVAGGIVCVMTRFNRILNIDTANLIGEAEPGVVTSDFQAAVERQGLFYPPDPASREFSTLGGNAAENAGGTRAVKYGVTRDYILGLEAVIGTGEIVQTGVRTPKGVVGYDLTRLLVGSEGTLGIITRLTLRLLPKPEAVETVLAFFNRLSEAAEVVAAITAERVIPATMEFMDRAALNCVRKYAGLDLDEQAGALLLVETDGPAETAKNEARTVARICRDHRARSIHWAEDRNQAEVMWQARRAVSPALFNVATGKLNEDIVVPRSLIPEMIDRIEAISQKQGVTVINFGHAGDGNIHVNVMFDQASADERRAAEAAVSDIFDATLELGGTLSGEHGIGVTKSEYIDRELDRASLELMKRLKSAFDPKGILNPGKIFPSGR